ncbi:MAG: ComF family protein [Fimbriimonadaceae bacterium]|nr:ComF family protein [Fimbriimonadaceae bacterium]QYK57641.1 MAG: ComF family protein [Fimbriimonadaceae bacterium]
MGRLRLSWADLAGLVYPPRCSLCGTIGEPPVCSECREEFGPPAPSRDWADGIAWSRSLFLFEGRAAQAVRRLKYGRATSLARPMAEMIEQARVEAPAHDVIVPVPIHWVRRTQRGFNQSELLAELAPRDLTRPGFLVRTRFTRPQVGLTAKERLVNLTGAFKAGPAVRGARVLLIDDVVTSGGTALACAHALRMAGALETGLLTFCGEFPSD